LKYKFSKVEYLEVANIPFKFWFISHLKFKNYYDLYNYKFI
jgi:hypothetical protein